MDPPRPAAAASAAGRIEADEVADLLQGLVERSLAHYDQRSGRCRLLDSVRQYAMDKLSEAPEAGACRERHRDCFVELAESAAPQLNGPGQEGWLARLDAEQDNLRAAMDWCLVSPGPRHAGLRMAASLCRFWLLRGWWREALDRARMLLGSAGPEAPPALRGDAIGTVSAMLWALGEYESSRACDQHRLDLARQTGDRAAEARALNGMGLSHLYQGHLSRAAECFQPALALFQADGDSLMAGQVLNNMSILASERGDFDEARRCGREALSRFRAAGHVALEAGALGSLGSLERRAGRLLAARRLLEQSLEINRALDNPGWVAANLNNLGTIDLQQDRLDEAESCFGEALRLCREIGSRAELVDNLLGLGRVRAARGEAGPAWTLAREAAEVIRAHGLAPQAGDCLVLCAELRAREEDWEGAGRLVGAAEALRAGLGLCLEPAEQARRRRLVEAGRRRRGGRRFLESVEAGGRMDMEAALALVLGEEC